MEAAMIRNLPEKTGKSLEEWCVVLKESGLTEISPVTLYDRGLIAKKSLVKVLGRGEIKRAVNVKTHAISASAEAAITSAGGSVEKLDLPFSIRPAAKGNALTNR